MARILPYGRSARRAVGVRSPVRGMRPTVAPPPRTGSRYPPDRRLYQRVGSAHDFH
ncbi:Hypothetical protein SCLAV_1490 [Streptomyces clavuligerus]|uniref:Uncharacterized protein n=1 Tax=Streptomyces clavuligerus TaxID=1901 RepID=B5GXI2_STRCL|nr:hypothetical protein SSCG_04153 [Streptomyces clavuligerus]EFG06565.1 Hypothetical protein SCLAV_1490 [Streptomyces clavuligerus]